MLFCVAGNQSKSRVVISPSPETSLTRKGKHPLIQDEARDRQETLLPLSEEYFLTNHR